jgi:hypothetical protein
VGVREGETMARENGEAAATGCFKGGAVANSVERNGGGRGPMLGRHAARGGGTGAASRRLANSGTAAAGMAALAAHHTGQCP